MLDSRHYTCSETLAGMTFGGVGLLFGWGTDGAKREYSVRNIDAFAKRW